MLYAVNEIRFITNYSTSCYRFEIYYIFSAVNCTDFHHQIVQLLQIKCSFNAESMSAIICIIAQILQRDNQY